MKTKVGGMWYVVGGERKTGAGDRGQRPAHRQRAPASVAQFVTRVKTAQELEERILFLRERCGNVYENKGRWYVVGGRWGKKDTGSGLGTWDKRLHAAGARQHQSLNLSLGSKLRRNSKKEFSF